MNEMTHTAHHLGRRKRVEKERSRQLKNLLPLFLCPFSFSFGKALKPFKQSSYALRNKVIFEVK